jgi:rhodanese-related sulfurtransferase
VSEEDIMTTTAMDLVKDAASQLEQVSPATANDERTAGSAVFVDVREAEEWQHGHIEGSVPAPRGLLEFFADPTSPRHKKELDPGRRVIMVCASGARASLAGMTMKSIGYQDVAVLAGGLKGWTEAGLPTCEHDYAGI